MINVGGGGGIKGLTAEMKVCVCVCHFYSLSTSKTSFLTLSLTLWFCLGSQCRGPTAEKSFGSILYG